MLLAKVAHAQTFSKVLSNPTVGPLFTKISDNILTPIIDVLFLLAFVMFVWGVFSMISHADDADARKTGQSNVLWGVVGMVIMLSVYGIIRLIAATLQVPDPFL